MSDDLTTLLRDAGRAPTIELDVEQVHTRGRRRAAGRRVAAVTGALVVLGVVGVGVAALLPDTTPAPFVEEGPTIERPGGDAPPVPGGDEAFDDAPDGDEVPTDAPRAGATASLTGLGVTAVDVVRSFDGAGGLHVRVVSPDGVVDEFSTAAGALPPLGSHVVVDHHRNLWFNDADPNLLVGGAHDALGQTFLRAEDAVGWAVLGSSESGEPLLAPAVGAVGQLPSPDEFGRQLVRVPQPDSQPPGTSGSVSGIAGISIRDSLGDEWPFAADAVPEHLAVLSGAGESQTAWWHQAGGESRRLAEIGGLDSWFVDLAFVDDEVWVVAVEDGVTNLWVTRPDDHVVLRVATPVGRGQDGFVVDIQAEPGPDGPVVVLSTAAEEDENGPAYRVDVDAARAVASDDAAAVARGVPTGVYDVLDARGHVHLLPAPDPVAGPLATCATEDVDRINRRPALPVGHLWFQCWDAAGSLPDGVLHGYVASERFTGRSAATTDEAGLRALLEAWAAGPTAAEEDAGLSGGLDDEVATFTDVTVEDGAVTVDLSAGPGIGVLDTTSAGASLVHQLAGIVFQFDGHDTLTITLDGSCERYVEQTLSQRGDEDTSCPTYDESHAPWNQGAGSRGRVTP